MQAVPSTVTLLDSYAADPPVLLEDQPHPLFSRTCPETASLFLFYVNCPHRASICSALTPSELAPLIKCLFFLLSPVLTVKVTE
jgi:hypothetical protein